MNAALRAFLILVQVLSTSANTFVFERGEPSLNKGFSLSFGHSIEKNHDSCFIGILIYMKGKVGLHGHKLFIGISSFSTELFREGSFNFHIVIFFVDKRIYGDGGMGGEESGELGGSVTISTFSSIDLALFLQYILSYHDM